MKTFYFSFFIISFLMIMTLAIFSLDMVSSEEAPKYNFGTMQAAQNFNIAPGSTIETKLYFYNIYGNRATHIKLNISQIPKDWKIEFLPALASKEYDISGVKTSVQENLVVQVSNASQTKGQDTDTINYISSQVGWIGSNFVTIKITVPESMELGKSENIQINAIAFWLGQGGSVALQQERSFDYTATTVSETYYETEVSSSSLARKISSIFSQTQIKPIYALMTGVTLLLVIVLIILFVLMNKRLKKEKTGKQKKRSNKREKGA